MVASMTIGILRLQEKYFRFPGMMARKPPQEQKTRLARIQEYTYKLGLNRNTHEKGKGNH
jgi:hypothetical protein